jgi:hypothetical protein
VVLAASFLAALTLRPAVKSHRTLRTECYTAANLSEGDGHSSWCPPCFERLESVSAFRLLMQGYLPLGRQ